MHYCVGTSKGKLGYKYDVSLKAGIHPIVFWRKYTLDLNLPYNNLQVTPFFIYIDTTKPKLVTNMALNRIL